MLKKLFVLFLIGLVFCFSGCSLLNDTKGKEPSKGISSEQTTPPNGTTQTPKPATDIEITVDNGTEVKIIVSDEELSFDGQQPIVKDGEVLVPVLGVFEHLLGANENTDAPFTVKWDEATSTATIRNSWYTVVIIKGEHTFTCNNKSLDTSVPLQTINGVFMLPLKAIAEAMGVTVEWNQTTKAISVFYESQIKIVTNN
jgi:hypothetical protein